MQALQATSFVGARVAAKPAAPRTTGAKAMVVRASAEDVRKAVLSFGAAGLVSLSVVGSAFAEATTTPQLVDDTKINAGVQLIYEARDLDIDAKPRSDQPTRFAFQKLTVEQTKARAGESLNRITGSVAGYSNKKYWTQAQNELRRQIGTLRFDLDNLVAAKGSGSYETDQLIKDIETLDFAFRKKSPEKAASALAAVTASAAAVKAALL